MANSIRNPPQIDLDGTNRCPLYQSHVNYDQTIHEFSNKVVSRVQLHSQPNTLPRKPLNLDKPRTKYSSSKPLLNLKQLFVKAKQ